MVHLLRKYQQTLMLLVTGLVIISFVWFYNYNKDPYGDRGRVGVVYGRNVSQVEFERGHRLFEVAYALRLFDLLQTLVAPARSEDEAKSNFVWNSIVLRHEADHLGIAATDEEVVAQVQQLPVFQTNGAYDSTKYNQFVEHELEPRGMTAAPIEDLMRDNLRLEKLKKLLGTTVAAAPDEVRTIFERLNRKTQLSVVRIALEEFKKAVQVTEEEVKKLFEERKETLKTEELRKVKYVAFVLPPADKPLVGKERVEQMQKLADEAEQFALAMTEKDAKFEEVAQKLGTAVKESPAFPQTGPPEELSRSNEVAQTTFEKLTKEQPNSDPIVTDNGYYVVQLVDITPSRAMTLEEAQGKLKEQLESERAQEAMNLKATEIRTKIESELKTGKSFLEAATAAGVKGEALPPFSFAEPPPPDEKSPDSQLIMGRSADLADGELSAPLPTATGLALVHVDQRLPVDEGKFEQEKAMLTQNVTRVRRDSVFGLWLKTQRELAHIQVVRG